MFCVTDNCRARLGRVRGRPLPKFYVTVQRKVFLTILSQEFENESFFSLSSSLLGDRFVTH